MDPELGGVVSLAVVDEVVLTVVVEECCFTALASVAKHSVCRNNIGTKKYI